MNNIVGPTMLLMSNMRARMLTMLFKHFPGNNPAAAFDIFMCVEKCEQLYSTMYLLLSAKRRNQTVSPRDFLYL